jgi:hypothetical protein
MKDFDLFGIEIHPIPLNPHGLRTKRTSPDGVLGGVCGAGHGDARVCAVRRRLCGGDRRMRDGFVPSARTANIIPSPTSTTSRAHGEHSEPWPVGGGRLRHPPPEQRHGDSRSPQQNGVIECQNAMVVGTTSSLLKEKGLPAWFWGEAVITVVYLLNRVPTKAVEGRTPFEVWYGKKPVVHHLKTFGCIVYIKNMKPHLKKMEDRGRKMIFVGYECRSKAY